MNNDREIGPVRPIFNMGEEPAKTKKCERLVAGSNSSGIFIDITRKGLEVNAYYTGANNDTKYAVLSQGVSIPWEELEKIRHNIMRPNRKTSIAPAIIEEEVDMEYLKTLPIVHINGKKYYVDPQRRERRAVDNPKGVWKF